MIKQGITDIMMRVGHFLSFVNAKSKVRRLVFNKEREKKGSASEPESYFLIVSQHMNSADDLLWRVFSPSFIHYLKHQSSTLNTKNRTLLFVHVFILIFIQRCHFLNLSCAQFS